jgi:nucleoside-diphosphate-sugar epimerase
MKILITGNLGYIGTVCSELLSNKHDVTGYDKGLYLESYLEVPFKLEKQIIKDVRDVEDIDIKNFDIIVHLSALSNDPLGQLNPLLTREINFEATVKLAKLAKKNGVKRFIYISSQSMYGVSNTNNELDEYDSEKNPITEYAKTKWKAEKELFKLDDKEFTVVAFRPSTVFGVSPRLRCDIVYNNLLASAYTTNKIIIKSDGTPWRPVVHVRDVVSAIEAGIDAPTNLIKKQSFNVGIPNGNYTINDLADAVKKIIPNCEIKYTNENKDNRTYRVGFKKILTELKDYYKPKWNLLNGGKELLNFFKKINFTEKDFLGEKTNRLVNLKNKIKNNVLDNTLR